MSKETPEGLAERMRKYQPSTKSGDVEWIPGKLRTDFAVFAKVDKTNINRFLVTCMEAYVNRDPEFMTFWSKALGSYSLANKTCIQDHLRRKKERDQGEALMKFLGIVEDPEEQKFDFYEKLKEEEKLNDRE